MLLFVSCLASTAQAISLAIMGGERLVPVPTDFGWTPPFRIYRQGGTFRTTLNIASYAPACGKWYYVKNGGSDSDTGLSLDHAYASIWKGLTKADVDCLWIASGTYGYDDGWRGTASTRNISVYGNGAVVTMAKLGATWSLTSGHVYEMVPGGAIGMVVDHHQVDADGDYLMLTTQTSIADVEANPGSWYYSASDAKVYVRLSDDAVPNDTNTWAMRNAQNGRVQNNVTNYIQDIKWYGGSSVFSSNNPTGLGRNVYLNNTEASYGTSNGYSITMGGDTIFNNCKAVSNRDDAISYGATVYGTTAVEIGCITRKNGIYNITSNYNGTTAHGGTAIVRINSSYSKSYGPNVVDINEGKAWLLGVTASSSIPLTAGQSVNFWIKGKMWLDSCVSGGTSIYDLAPQEVEDIIYVHNTTLNVGASKGLGSVVGY